MMDDCERNVLIAALSQKDVYPKALASFMFREVIEDAHSKYNISQNDMREMCREAVNRAALFLAVQTDPNLYRAFAVNAIAGLEWDESEMTEELYERMGKVYEAPKRLSSEE
ncbi:MAG: hypothetical protein QM689_03225 [Oscillospiraceae bacterium]